ncbi:MAG: small subunit ribosomal protein S19 [Alphaproteobacteria bacterium]|jgi:small subunit ribosomal protein S19
MARSTWKGPFIDPKLLNKVKLYKQNNANEPLKTWSRRSTIVPIFVGITFLVHNGKKHIPVYVTEDMIGHKLGEFSPTRKLPSHSSGAPKKKGKR